GKEAAHGERHELPVALSLGEVAERVHELVSGGDEGVGPSAVGRRGDPWAVQPSARTPEVRLDEAREPHGYPFSYATHGAVTPERGARWRCRSSRSPR